MASLALSFSFPNLVPPLRPTLIYMSNPRLSFRGLAVAISLASSVVWAQPSPAVQQRITAANQTDIDYTAFVNPFIGTGAITYGDVW